MDAVLTRLIRQLAPWTALAALVAKSVVTATAPLSNSDTFFHLRIGAEFLDGWRPWSPQSLGTPGTADWIPTQWLSQVALAAIDRHLGTTGLAAFYGILLISVVITWYAAARSVADPLGAALVTGLAFLAAGSALSLRPQVVSYLLMTCTVAIWLRARQGAKPPWLLIPLVWLWAMVHGMWIVGVAVSGLLAVGATLDRSLPRRALWVPLAMAIACAATPAGPRLYLAIFDVNSRADYFGEWGPPSLVSASGLAAVALLVAVVAAFLGERRATAWDIAIMVCGLGLLIYSARTVPLAAALLVIPAAGHLQQWIGAPARAGQAERWGVGLGAGCAGLALVSLLALRPPGPPTATEPFLKSLNGLAEGTTLLTDSDMGGFLLWSDPRLHIPVHGYADMYTDEELRDLNDLLHLAPHWVDTLNALHANYALLRDSTPLRAALSDRGWTPVVRGEGRVLLKRPAAEQAPR